MDYKDLHVNDYIHYKYREWGDEPINIFVGFITKKKKNGFMVYSEICITQKEWNLEEHYVEIGDIYRKLELETLEYQLLERYPEIFI